MRHAKETWTGERVLPPFQDRRELRAQTFEVLTGGDFAGDNAERNDERSVAEQHGVELSGVPLLEEMVDDLRVRLRVWGGQAAAA